MAQKIKAGDAVQLSLPGRISHQIVSAGEGADSDAGADEDEGQRPRSGLGGDRAEGIDVALLGAAVDLGPELLGALLGEGVLDLDVAAQADDVGGGVATLDALPAGVGRPIGFEGLDLLFASRHR